MSEENGKVCCNCRHNIRTGEIINIECHCDIDNHYIGYIDCMTHWCRHWSKEREDNMQIVVELDDELYKTIKNPKKLETMYHAGRLCEAVRKGTPLPKGHGRLIDADKLANEIYVIDSYSEDAVIEQIKDAPTIIEKDKESEE